MCVIRLFALAALAMQFHRAHGAEQWELELASMPLQTNRIHFSKGEPARAILRAFRPNSCVKAIVMMPGATDELYFNDKGSSVFPSESSVIDALRELTNHTSIRLLFRSPFLLLSETNDYGAPLLAPVEFESYTILGKRSFSAEWVMLDKEWDHLYPSISKYSGLKVSPPLGSPDAWHFYRVYFAAFGLNTLEAVQLVSLATQTEVYGKRGELQFRRRPAFRQPGL